MPLNQNQNRAPPHGVALAGVVPLPAQFYRLILPDSMRFGAILCARTAATRAPPGFAGGAPPQPAPRLAFGVIHNDFAYLLCKMTKK